MVFPFEAVRRVGRERRGISNIVTGGDQMKKLLTVLVAAAMVLSFVGLASAKKLFVATDTNFKPFSFKNSDGNYVGFDLDLWDAIAKKAGLEYEMHPMDFNGIIPGVQTGNIDVAVAGMSVKSSREKVIDFSFPYFRAGIVIMVRPDNTDIKTIEDFEGKTVCTKLATSSVDYIKDHGKPAKLTQLPNISDCFLELVAGGADAVMFDLPPLADYANNAGKGKVKVVGPLYMGHHYAIGLPAGSDIRDKITIAIIELSEDGTYDKIYKKWFGKDPEWRP